MRTNLPIMGLFNSSKTKTNEEVTPVEPQVSASVDAEKCVDSSASSEKGRDGESLSSNAQAGVKAVEAATTVWTRYHLIAAYLMSVSHEFFGNFIQANNLKYMVDLLRHRPPRSRRTRHEPIRYQRFPPTLAHCRDGHHVLHHRGLDQDSACKAARYMGPTSGTIAVPLCLDGGIHHDGVLSKRRNICCSSGFLIYRVGCSSFLEVIS